MRRLLYALGAITAVSIAVILQQSASAAFNFFGRAENYNYYDNKNDNTYGYYLFDGVGEFQYAGIKDNWEYSLLTVDEFIGEFKKRLDSPNSINSSHAAVVINMMMGRNGNSAAYNGPSAERWRNGVAIARQDFPRWEALVRAYNAAGRVNFNNIYNDRSPFDWLGSGYNDGTRLEDAYPVTLGGQDISNLPSITFYDEKGQPLLNLQKKCVNITGSSDPLIPLDPPVQTREYTITPGVTFPDGGGAVKPGDSFVVNLTASYTSPTSTQPDPFTMTGIETKNNAGGVVTGIRAWPNQIFTGGNVIATGRSFTVTVPAGAPSGSEICFINRIDKANEKGEPADSVPACRGIYGAYTASIVGLGGDIHAGSGACAADPTGSGHIKGGAANSFGEYLVSAAGIFNPRFGSYGNGDTTSGRLGQNGDYLTICRPDLYNLAKTTTLPSTTYGGTEATLATLYAADAVPKTGIVRVPAGFKLLGGTTGTYPLTIVSEGDITIVGNIRNISVGDRDAQSSIGIIAGNILIKTLATQVDAFMFADKKLTTCDDPANACKNTLTVNGFIMANSFSLGRAGYIGGQSTEVSGEIIKMNGQLYLNPPKLFNVSVQDSANVTQAQGERPVRR